MGRWEPDARGRLQEAAMYLYAENGYEKTTVAEIAERAGLTKRTFFRYFADKREVLFFGSDHFQERFVAAIRESPAGASAMECIEAGLDAVARMIDQDRGREFATLRQRIIMSTPELQERELIKLAAVVTASADALIERGVEPLQAQLTAETGMAIVKVAFARWIAETNTLAFTAVMRACSAELQSVFTR
jgi:AcrR family transcriptional regulator